MRFFGILLIVGILVTGGDALSQEVSGTFKFKKGGDVTGRIGFVGQDGIIFKKENGGNTKRYGFHLFEEESLKALMKHPKVRPYGTRLLAPTGKGGDGTGSMLPPAPKLKGLDPPQVGELEDRPELPESRSLLGALFGTGGGQIMLLLAWAANIWAGFHIGIYRRWNKWMVPGISAAAPIIAPIVFISMKPKKLAKKVSVAEEEKKEPAKVPVAKAKAKVVTSRPGAGAGAAAGAAAGGAVRAASGAAAAGSVPGGGAPLAAPPQPGAAAEPKALEAVAYVKGEVNINKRFIETKFAPFFKLIPDEPYRSAWLCFITTRGEFWAKRIPKISQMEVTIQCPQEGDTTRDQICQISDIKEIHLRPPE